MNIASGLCHFCGKPGYMMMWGCCNALKQYIHQESIRHGADGKIVLPSGTNILTYVNQKTFQGRIDEWHRWNSGNLATGNLVSMTMVEMETIPQQALNHKVLQLNMVSEQLALTWEKHSEMLEWELKLLKNQVFDGMEIRKGKQLLKDYKPASTLAEVSKLPAPSTDNGIPAVGKTMATEPFLHLYLGLPSNHVPPNNRNYEMLDKPMGEYWSTAPIYDIEKSKEIFDHIIKSQVMVLIEELCSIVPDVQNQI